MEENNLLELLSYIPPDSLSYTEWVNVGMALKHEGYTANDWDEWSRNDVRYHAGECYTKWDSFQGTSSPVTGGTIYHMALENGYVPSSSYDDGRGALGWEDSIKYDNDYKLIDKSYIDGKEFKTPTDEQWNPVQEIVRYLDTLFESDDIVAYATESYEKIDETTGAVEKYLPKKGAYDRTAGELIDKLLRCNGKINEVLGDYNTQAGAWVRFNPMDGKGVKNENVAQFRYALVESDNMDLEKQNAIVRELQLPIATLVYSGSKSIHAIVRVEAANKEEYKKRVDYLYKICKKNGLNVDEQNKNPSRLSRLPGFIRGDKKQFIIDTNIGYASWDEWYQYIEDLNDELPDPEQLSDCWEDMPTLAPELIKGVLRQGHKMLIAGPSKAGKSFALINMSISIAEGYPWFGWECAKGKVLYVNLELDRASCLHRFKDVYQALGIQPLNLKNIDIWNLRGKTVPMDKLAPKLIRRAHNKGYIAVIIDPIYKVLTGDENSADQMAHFTNQFDKVATELGSSVIYCHHHSKGSQGGKKSMDRASGSGVFARDPDALIDLVELELTEDIRGQLITTKVTTIVQDAILQMNKPYYDNYVTLDDLNNVYQMKQHLEKAVPNIKDRYPINEYINQQTARIENTTAWRVDGTLREFAKFKPRDVWFNYPIHTVDGTGILSDIQLDDNTPSWKKNFDKSSKRQTPEEREEAAKKSFETAYNLLDDGLSPVKLSDMCDYFGRKHKTIRRKAKEHGGFVVRGDYVYRV